MAKRTGDQAPVTDDADLMAVVEATDPKAQDEVAATVDSAPTAEPPRVEPRQDAPVPAPARRGGVSAFLGMVLGGVIAAAAGFGLARYMPDLLPMGTATPDPALQAQAEELAALREQVASLAARPAASGDLEARLAALEQAAPTEDDARLTAIEAALAEVLARPAATGGVPAQLTADVAAMKDQIAALGSGGVVSADVTAAVEAAEARLKQAEERAAELAATAEAAGLAARRAAALDRIAAALDSGAPFAAALRDLPADAVAPVLADNAAAGLPTVAALRDGFADPARAALEAALRANMGESWTERVSNFLRSQTGLRSLSPRDGDDPDAVLSRAEAALGQGKLAEALVELEKLPEAGKPALADWVAQAQVRIEAEAAFAALAAN